MQIKHFLNYLYAYIDVIGKVAIKLPGVGKIQGFVASKLGWFIVVLLPAMGVIIYDIFKILKLVKSKKIVDNISGDNNKEQINANKQIDITAEQEGGCAGLCRRRHQLGHLPPRFGTWHQPS